MKQQFDMAVETAYQESVLTPVLDQDEPEEGHGAGRIRRHEHGNVSRWKG